MTRLISKKTSRLSKEEIKSIKIEDEFIEQATRDEQLIDCKLSAYSIAEEVEKIVDGVVIESE